MPDDKKQYDEICRARFDRIDKDGQRREAKIDALNVLISGNGEPGMNERLRTVEASRAGAARVGWIALSAVIVVAIGVIAKFIIG